MTEIPNAGERFLSKPNLERLLELHPIDPILAYSNGLSTLDLLPTNRDE
jgi:hypothetical protein